MAAMRCHQRKSTVRFATPVPTSGKTDAKELWPRHRGHGPAGVKLVEQLCACLQVPNGLRRSGKAGRRVSRSDSPLPAAAKTLVKLFDNVDARRRPQRVGATAYDQWKPTCAGAPVLRACDYPQGSPAAGSAGRCRAVSTKGRCRKGFRELRFAKS